MALLQKKLILLRQQRSATDCMQHTCNTHLEDHIGQTMSNTYHMYISACYVICSNQFDLSLYTFLCSRPHLGNKVLTCNNSAPLVLGGNTPGASRSEVGKECGAAKKCVARQPNTAGRGREVAGC